MAYEYDVFISYKRGGTKDKWLETIFRKFFDEYLEDLIFRKSKIFVDKTGLAQGADWSDGIIYALAHSRCLVAIISPIYFMNSEWCIKEFLTIKHRQQKLNLQAGTIPPIKNKVLKTNRFPTFSHFPIKSYDLVFQKIFPLKHFAFLGKNRSCRLENKFEFTNFNLIVYIQKLKLSNLLIGVNLLIYY